MLDSLYEFKSKVMVFRNTGKKKSLGFILHYNNTFPVTEKHLYRGRKATFVLYSNTKSLYLNIETVLSQFDCYITTVISYASEVWGYQKGKVVETVHLDVSKRLLGVKMIY